MRSFYAEREVKSVGNSMTFAHNLVGEEACRLGLTALCDNVGRRLRARGLVCRPCSSASATRIFTTVHGR